MALDLKSLESLEDKIKRAMTLIQRLRDENQELQQKLDTLESQVKDSENKGREYETMKVSAEQLEKELKTLQEEREHVLTRVDGLLEDLAQLDLD